MPRIFDMVEMFGDGEHYIGTFSIFDSAELVVQLFDGLHLELEVPVQFARSYQKGKRIFRDEEVMLFVKERILPQNRMGILGSLHENGVLEYDPLFIFLLHQGQWCTDSLRIVER